MKMLPLKITITPSMLVFNELTETGHLHLIDDLNLLYNDKDHYFLKGEQKELYKILLKLSYTYDIELY